MTELPNLILNREAQGRFIQTNQAFLEEYPRLIKLCNGLFTRVVDPRNEQELERLCLLPEDDPEVVAFEDKLRGDKVIYFLGRIAMDDFGEILVLAGNALGFGALKILRGMYERTVTAMYIHKKPSEVRAFADDAAIMKGKYFRRVLDKDPAVRDALGNERMDRIFEQYEAAKKRRSESFCNRCNQPKSQEAWTRVSLDSMAQEVSPQLAAMYHRFYLEGTAQSHANAFGMEARLSEGSAITSYKQTSEEEARMSIQLGHQLLIRMCGLQNDHFDLGIDQELLTRAEAYNAVWAAESTA